MNGYAHTHVDRELGRRQTDRKTDFYAYRQLDKGFARQIDIDR